MEYGARIAAQRARANAMRRKAGGVKRINATVSQPTQFELYPMREWVGEVRSRIDWSGVTTDRNARELAGRLAGGGCRMQLLQQPAGTGKTAVAVKAAALILAGEPNRKVMLLASRAIIDAGTWQATIAEWNASNPSLAINPAVIDTYDRMARVLGNKTTAKTLTTELGDRPLIIIDEVHNYKNPTSKRAKSLQKLKDADILGLSATPLTNNVVLDMGSYLIMAKHYRNKTDYFNTTGLADRMGKYTNELHVYNAAGRIDPGLWPEYPTVLSQFSRVIYAPDVSVMVDKLPNVDTPMHRLAESDSLAADLRSLDKAYRERMFDSAGDYVASIQHRINTDEARLKWLQRTITSDGVQQPLVFYWHTAVKDAITSAFDTAGIGYQIISGEHSITEVDMQDTTKPIIVQYQAGGEGIEFPLSNTTVFFENQGSYARLVQARGRNVRYGMNHSVTQHYCVSSAPFDGAVLDRLLRREELSEEILAEIAMKVASE